MYRRYTTLRNGMARWRQRQQRSSRVNLRRGMRMSQAPRVRSGQGVTVQHDARRIYSRGRMPRRKKRIWRRFTRKVHAVSESDLGSRTVVFSKSISNVNSTDGSQSIQHIALYPGKSSTNHLNDLANISSYENTGNPTAAAGGTVSDTTKFIFKSAVLDLTFRNVSTIRASGVDTLDSDLKMEVDVYEIISSKEWSDSSGYYSTLGDAFGAKGNTIVPIIGNSGTSVDLGLRGVTPWDLPAALSYFRLRIIKKTKYFVNNGDTFTYQVRDPKRHVFMQERMELMAGANVPRASRHLLVVTKLIPGFTLGTTDGTYKESIQIGVTRKYFYKIEGFNEDRDKYVVQT